MADRSHDLGKKIDLEKGRQREGGLRRQEIIENAGLQGPVARTDHQLGDRLSRGGQRNLPPAQPQRLPPPTDEHKVGGHKQQRRGA